MNRQDQSQKAGLSVKVSFESNRLAAECLAHAYDQLVPLVGRPIVLNSQLEPVPSKPMLSASGGEQP
ncbi:MAG: hypothetical protein AAGE92_06915 [Cyanobacteria bacterium P01_G01_bin.4]